MSLATIQTDLIEEGRRLREVVPSQVSALVNSIADVGLLNPITVFPRKVIRAGISVEGFGLVAGAHRLAAVRELGLAEIDASIVSLSELERQIAECDENLCGPTLSPGDRAKFTARRKEAYEALHPETKNGGDRRGPDRQVGELKTADRFTADTATKTGQSERAVQRDAERGSKVDPAVIDLIRGTKLDTGAYLDKLKAVAREDQFRVAQGDLLRVRAEQQSVRSKIKVADAPLDDAEAHEKQFAALVAVWNRTAPEVRQRFRDEVIDTPVFDRSAA